MTDKAGAPPPQIRACPRASPSPPPSRHVPPPAGPASPRGDSSRRIPVSFIPVLCTIDFSFWKAVADIKLKDWQLRTPEVPVTASLLPFNLGHRRSGNFADPRSPSRPSGRTTTTVRQSAGRSRQLSGGWRLHIESSSLRNSTDASDAADRSAVWDSDRIRSNENSDMHIPFAEVSAVLDRRHDSTVDITSGVPNSHQRSSGQTSSLDRPSPLSSIAESRRCEDSKTSRPGLPASDSAADSRPQGFILPSSPASKHDRYAVRSNPVSNLTVKGNYFNANTADDFRKFDRNDFVYRGTQSICKQLWSARRVLQQCVKLPALLSPGYFSSPQLHSSLNMSSLTRAVNTTAAALNYPSSASPRGRECEGCDTDDHVARGAGDANKTADLLCPTCPPLFANSSLAKNVLVEVNAFLLLSFADLKSYLFYYNVALPAFRPDTEFLFSSAPAPVSSANISSTDLFVIGSMLNGSLQLPPPVSEQFSENETTPPGFCGALALIQRRQNSSPADDDASPACSWIDDLWRSGTRINADPVPAAEERSNPSEHLIGDEVEHSVVPVWDFIVAMQRERNRLKAQSLFRTTSAMRASTKFSGMDDAAGFTSDLNAFKEPVLSTPTYNIILAVIDSAGVEDGFGWPLRSFLFSLGFLGVAGCRLSMLLFRDRYTFSYDSSHEATPRFVCKSCATGGRDLHAVEPHNQQVFPDNFISGIANTEPLSIIVEIDLPTQTNFRLPCCPRFPSSGVSQGLRDPVVKGWLRHYETLTPPPNTPRSGDRGVLTKQSELPRSTHTEEFDKTEQTLAHEESPLDRLAQGSTPVASTQRAPDPSTTPPPPIQAVPQTVSYTFIVDLRKHLDPLAIQAVSVMLNVRLIQWRTLKQFDPSRLQRMKFLLIGVGTLGCAIARNLIAWGVSQMTLIDAGRVSHSTPVRQTLYTHEDAAAYSGRGKLKVIAAKSRLLAIRPDLSIEAIPMEVPMPGHSHYAVSLNTSSDEASDPTGDQSVQNQGDLSSSEVPGDLESSVATLQRLIATHDVVLLLTDSRESRWLPALLSAARQYQPHTEQPPPICITVALGFDTFVVMRHGHRRRADVTERPMKDSGAKLACYFCNDLSAPTDAFSSNRPLDHQCTVTRPGISSLASSVASELIAALSQHPLYPDPPHSSSDPGTADPEGSCLGATPHTVRGNLASFNMASTVTESFEHCICCSEKIIKKYLESGVSWLKEVVQRADLLEEVSGLAEMKKGSRADEVFCFDDESEIEGELDGE